MKKREKRRKECAHAKVHKTGNLSLIDTRGNLERHNRGIQVSAY